MALEAFVLLYFFFNVDAENVLCVLEKELGYLGLVGQRYLFVIGDVSLWRVGFEECLDF